MKKNTELLSGAAMVLSYCAFLFWLSSFTYLENQCQSLSLSPLLPVLFLLGVYFLDVFLAGRNCPLSIFVGLQLVLAAVFIWLLLRCTHMVPFHMGSAIFLSIFAAGGVFACAYAAEDPVEQKNLSFYFDSVIVLLIVLLLADHFLPMFLVKEILTVSLLALLLNMLALSACRRARAGTHFISRLSLTRVLPFVLVGLILILAGLFILTAASGAQSLSQALWQALLAAGQAILTAGSFLMNKLEQFLLWLIQFLPQPGSDGAEGAPMELPMGDGGGSTGQVIIPRYFYHIAAVVGALLLLKFLLSMLREKAGSPQKQPPTETSSRRSPSVFSFRALCRGLLDHFRYLFLRIRLRDSAPGLLLWCERHVPKDMKRRSGESASAFLQRISDKTPVGDCQDALMELAQLLEQQFYAPENAVPPLPKATIRAIRKEFSQNIRPQNT